MIIKMPNHCYNSLVVQTVDRCEEARNQLKDYVKKSQIPKEDAYKDDYTFSMNGVVPMPEELNMKSGYPKTKEEKAQNKSNIEKYGHADWYDWRCANWGTKWDAYDVYISSDDNDEDYFHVSFDSAWSPVIEYIEKASILYPLLKFELEYEESGMDIAGSIHYQFGEVIFEEEMTYDVYYYLNNKESFFDTIADDIECDCYESLEDYKECRKETWDVITDDDKKEIEKLFKESVKQ